MNNDDHRFNLYRGRPRRGVVGIVVPSQWINNGMNDKVAWSLTDCERDDGHGSVCSLLDRKHSGGEAVGIDRGQMLSKTA